jgi:epoxyqueuosine reductase
MPIPSERIKEKAREVGFDLVGICPAGEPPHYAAYLEWLRAGWHGQMHYMARTRSLRKNPQTLLEGAKSILCVGLNYYQPLPPVPEGAGRISRYALGRDYHKVIRKKLRQVATWGEKEYPGLRTRICVDSAPILEREFAWLAGLGWFGKNTCLINTHRGSYFFIGLLLLSEEFEADAPAVGDCGRCRRCIDACPTGALIYQEGDKVAILDATKCISYLTIEYRGEFTEEQKDRLHGWVFGCDVCQEVCPFNKPRPHQPLRAQPTREEDFLPREKLVHPPLRWLANLSDEEFVKVFAGSAVMRAGPAQMRRNARAVLQSQNVLPIRE